MTPKQKAKMKKALGDGSGWPKITDDAEVNYEIDRGLHPDFNMLPWDQVGLAEKALYLEEASKIKKAKLIRK